MLKSLANNKERSKEGILNLVSFVDILQSLHRGFAAEFSEIFRLVSMENNLKQFL